MVFRGIHLDTTNFTMSIPPQNLVSIQSILAQLKVRTTATRKQLQSLLGTFPGGLSFINRLLNTLRNFSEKTFRAGYISWRISMVFHLCQSCTDQNLIQSSPQTLPLGALEDITMAISTVADFRHN